MFSVADLGVDPATTKSWQELHLSLVLIPLTKGSPVTMSTWTRGHKMAEN